MADPNQDMTWTVSRYRKKIGQGDIVFIWETGRERGIRAVLRAKGEPQQMPELESEQAYWTERDTEDRWRVQAEITHRNVNLSYDDLRSIPDLEELSVFHGIRRGTNFEVKPKEGVILMRLISE